MKTSIAKFILLALLILMVLTGARAIQIHNSQEVTIRSLKTSVESYHREIQMLQSEKNDITDSLEFQLEEQAKKLEAIIAELERTTDLYEIYKNRHEETTDKVIYLTFDDGPSDQVTEQVLDILAYYDIKATFFVTGKASLENPDILKRIFKEGHAIGNHSRTHIYEQIYASTEAFKKDFLETQEIIFDIIGQYPTLYRYPGGSLTARNFAGRHIQREFDQVLMNHGVQYFDWNIDSGDASAEYATIQAIESNAIFQLRNKQEAIVLMHDTNSKLNTVRALPRIIETYIERGYKFEVLTPTGFTVQHLY